MSESTSPAVTLATLEAELAAYYAGLAVLLDECFKPGSGRRMLGISEAAPLRVEGIDVRTTRIGKMLPVWFKYAYEGVMSAGFSVEGTEIADGPFERLRDMVALLRIDDSYFEWCLEGARVDSKEMKHAHLAALVARVEARYSLDTGSQLTIPELALLADMNERSVRNAISASGEARLEVSESGYVSNQEAQRWLSKRRGFVPTRIRKLPTNATVTPDSLDAVEIPRFIESRLTQVVGTGTEANIAASNATGLPVWMCAANSETGLSFDRLETLVRLPFDVKPSECEVLARALRVDPVWFTYQVMTALFPRQLDMLLNPKAWQDTPEPLAAESEVTWVTVELTGAMLAHGYIDLPASAKSLFPKDCFGTRAKGDEGSQIELEYGAHRAMSDIREKSAKTISPRRRFTSWLNTELGAKPGDRIRFERTGDRTFRLTHIPA